MDANSALGLVLPVFYVLGALSAVCALMSARTAQGAMAWIVALLGFPLLAVPLYWVFGRNRFHGYLKVRRTVDSELAGALPAQQDQCTHAAKLEGKTVRHRVLEKLAEMPFLGGNSVQLLVDGQATFAALFAAIDAAQDYILVQFYIVHDDRLGREFQQHLLAKARQGVRIYFLYDAIGSLDLSDRYCTELQSAGVAVSGFKTLRGPANRLQINFRNHRKIVVVDGQVGFVGGLNVGDEYMSRDPELGHWRDTHLEIHGPAVQRIQQSFLYDWYWAVRQLPAVNWQPERTADNRAVLVLPSGPADRFETCTLLFVHAIHAAERRVWLASPYLVPGRELIFALQLAALRGVDVRLLLPAKPDNWLVHSASQSYYREILRAGVQILGYENGFLHQKALVVDGDLAGISTANLDKRSFQLNFEISVLCADSGFAAETAMMLERDMLCCRRLSEAELDTYPFWFRLASRAARLLAPLL